MNNGISELIQAAALARGHALAGFSHYHVGAAVRTKSGEIIPGCNVEVPIMGLSKCAEQVALFAAIAKGHSEFLEIAVVTENGGTPCGACRQVIWDLCGDVPVHVADASGQIVTHRMKDLLPEAFDKSKLT